MPTAIARIHHVQALADHSRADPNEAAAARRVLGLMKSRQTAYARGLVTAEMWQDAAEALIGDYTSRGECFTAGEIARVIRLSRPDLRFSVRALIRFVADSVIDYDGKPAVEVERTTDGSTRSPTGCRFVVYAPSVDLGLRHDGEVEIPPPGPLALGAG